MYFPSTKFSIQQLFDFCNNWTHSLKFSYVKYWHFLFITLFKTTLYYLMSYILHNHLEEVQMYSDSYTLYAQEFIKDSSIENFPWFKSLYSYLHKWIMDAVDPFKYCHLFQWHVWKYLDLIIIMLIDLKLISNRIYL